MDDSGSQGPLTSESITTGLHTRVFGRTVITLGTVPSTNEFAKSLSPDEGPHGTVVTAEAQTSGRGRLGRHWVSPESKNLLVSILLRPNEADIMKCSLIPFVAAVAVANAIELETGLRVECKWPNDLLIGKKKVCGMLLESSMLGPHIEKLVLGIGVNVNQEEFSAEILPHATSLQLEKGREVNRASLLRHMLTSLEQEYAKLLKEAPGASLKAWRKKTTMFGTQITVREAAHILTGVAEALADDGSLIIRLDNGSLHTVRAGDVTLGYQQTFLHP